MNLKQFVCFLIVVFLIATTSLAQKNDSPRVEVINGDDLPVSIDSTTIYKIYSDSEQSIHIIDYLLTNKSDTYIGKIEIIQFTLDKNNKEILTAYWSELDRFQPFETKMLDTADMFLDSKSANLLWVVHSVCTDKGTWKIELNELRKAIFPYSDGKNVLLPKAKFDQNKCLPD